MANTTNINSDSERLARLQSKGLGASTGAKNLENKLSGGTTTGNVPGTTTPISVVKSPLISKTINPDEPTVVHVGGVDPEKQANYEKEVATYNSVMPDAQKIEPATFNTSTVNTSTPTVNSTSTGDTNSQGNKSTITGGSFGSNGKQTSQQVVEGQTNKVIKDTVTNYDVNNTIDKTQFEQQKLAAEAKAMEVDTELKRQEAERIALAQEEDRIQKQKAAQETANMQALQEKERAANEASIAAAQAKADASERELQIANDIELQKSNVAFAKMGLTLSSAAVTSAQQIYTTGVYNLSKLKTENAFKMAELQVAVAKVEFDHTKVINDIINTSSEKSYEIRKKLNEDIHTIKNSIIDNRVERQKNIDKAIDNYQQAIKDNEEDVLNKMNKANDALTKNTEAFYSNLKKKEEYNTSKISTLVSSGKWYAMTPIARTTYEKGAGLPVGTVARQIQAAIGTKIYTQAQEITGLKGVSFSSADYNSMLTEAQRLAELGVPLDTAINQVVTSYLDKSPEYQNALAKQRKDATIRASGGGSGASLKGIYTRTEMINGVPTTVEYQEGNPNYKLVRGEASTAISSSERTDSTDGYGGAVFK